MKNFIVLMICLFVVVACQTQKESSDDSVVSNTEKHTEPFKYATLPDQSEWTVKLDKVLKIERQEIQSTEMPEPIWVAFPLPEFRSVGDLPMAHPGVRRSFGYGMDSAGCVPEALLKSNAIKEYDWGIGGGQYAHYQRVEKIVDFHLYDPRQHAFLIAYTGAYLEITFPDLQTMHVRRLKDPDMTKVKNCAPGDDWRCRFEDCGD